jgi:hypothetical protein
MRLTAALLATWALACGREPAPFVAVTFNTGTTDGLAHVEEGNDGYTLEQAALSDLYYGNGLAWVAVVEATREWFAHVQPDVVAFQEIFYSGECPGIPEEAREGFVCEHWQPGDPTVAQIVTGEGFQVSCHPGKSDKCLAVHRRFGTFRGCDGDFCLEGLDGFDVGGCGSGARVARGVIELTRGGTLTVVNIHGTSGISAEDQQCRLRQFEQAFVDLGDGQPGVIGERNLVMGDLNTDPARTLSFDASAVRLADFAGEGRPFRYLSDVGPDATPTYASLFNIDHVMADVLRGDCWVAGITDGHPPVYAGVHFDHRPVVCTVRGLD